MFLLLLGLAVLFLAYSNGANDNFKGVASLYGSHTCGYPTALTWATVTTAAGSVAAINTASYHGLPVSITHVSVGTLLGIGITTRQARWKPVMDGLLSWVVTPPCAAVLAAVVYRVVLAR
jgi:phosphate/sulfate permease